MPARLSPVVTAPLALDTGRTDAGERSAAVWGDAQEERAATIEFDGGAPREWAEGFARLDPGQPPDDVPSKRWQRFVDDAGKFLDNGWAAKAAALGWGPLDLFGAHRTHPDVRRECKGLLWLLDGRRLVALTADAAIIETPSGGWLMFRRRRDDAGAVLAWELIAEDNGRNLNAV